MLLKYLGPHKTIVVVFIFMIVLFTLTLVGAGFVFNDLNNFSHKVNRLAKSTQFLSLENEKRLNDIQRGRLHSCKVTYEGIHKVFKPFFPKHPQGQAKRDIIHFNKLIIKFEKGCSKQIHAPK